MMQDEVNRLARYNPDKRDLPNFETKRKDGSFYLTHSPIRLNIH